MPSFLPSVASHLVQKYGNDIGDMLLIFPNQRSIAFFRMFLTEEIKKRNFKTPVWMPEMLSITDFFGKISTLAPADTLTSTYALYQAYCQHTNSTESFDRFYPWGRILLTDFNDVDTNLANPAIIFETAKTWRDTSQLFPLLSPELRKSLQYFSNLLKEEQATTADEQQNAFVELWKVLLQVYLTFTETLAKQGIGTQGMIYSEALEKLDKKTELTNQTYFAFIGFNAFTKAEEKLATWLRQNRHCLFFFDYDKYYLAPGHEAGMFMRQNLKLFKPEEWGADFLDFTKTQKDIKLVSSPSDTLQTIAVSNLLQSGTMFDPSDAINTAVVLCDENLLLPLLNHLPENVGKINVTMGYPFKGSMADSYLGSYIKLHKTARITHECIEFNADALLSYCNHPLVRMVNPDFASLVCNDIITGNVIFYKFENVPENPIPAFFKIAFSQVDGTEAFVRNLTWQIEFWEENPDLVPQKSIHLGLLVKLKTETGLLHDIVVRNQLNIGLDVFIQVLRGHIAQINLPFEGEPLEGLQIMGLLETRNLDFKNVILVSAGDGLLPAASGKTSFIPYNFRKYFDLPYREKGDAMQAYNFYRLLQRATGVCAIYNSGPETAGKGEVSRFVLQLQHESPWKVKQLTEIYKPGVFKTMPIFINKTPEVLEKLSDYYSDDKKKALSASAYNTYLSCGLKFYFSYILGLKEPEEYDPVMGADMFGTVFHKCLEIIYLPFKEKSQLITRDDLDNLLKTNEKTDSVLRQAVREEMLAGKRFAEDQVMEGRNYISFEILKKYLHRVLQFDRDNCSPFYMLDMEGEYNSSLAITTADGIKKVKLLAKIDRVDRLDAEPGTIRLIDYKTGKAELKIDSLDDVFYPVPGKDKSKIFQLFFYAMVYRQNKGNLRLKAGIYGIRNQMTPENLYPTYSKNGIIDLADIETGFLEKLTRLTEEIFNPETPFSQTKDNKQCDFCIFKSICRT